MKKRLFTMCMAFMLVGVMFFAVPISSYAESDSVTTYVNAKNVNLKGYKYYKSKKVSTSMEGTLSWISATKAKFSGTTSSKYAGTVKADKITQTDTIKATGIGSFSASASKGMSISSSIVEGTAKYTYSVKNSKKLVNYPSYTASKGLTVSVTVTTASKFTFGSTNYRVIPGDPD